MKLEDNNKSIGQLRSELARLEKSIEHRNPPSILHGRVDELRSAIAARKEKQPATVLLNWHLSVVRSASTDSPEYKSAVKELHQMAVNSDYLVEQSKE